MTIPTGLVEWLTEHGTYLVTPEDKAALINDLAGYGTCALETSLVGDQVVAVRCDPKNLLTPS